MLAMHATSVDLGGHPKGPRRRVERSSDSCSSKTLKKTDKIPSYR